MHIRKKAAMVATISTASRGRISLSTLILLVHQSCWLAQGFVVSPASPQYATTVHHKASSSIDTLSSLSMAEHDDASLPDRRSVILGTMISLLFTTSFPPPSSASASASSLAISTATNTIPEWTLDNNVKFPTLALNTVGLSAKEATYALKLAVKSGMTHVDFHPGKERDGVAAYIASQADGRQGLFLNTKIRKPPPGTSPTKAALLVQQQLEEDLQILNVESVDMLMLRDSPDCSVMQAQWKVMEEALKAGKTRSIGVINYCQKSLECILETAEVKPAINYYMLHVGMGEDAYGLRTFGESKGIRTFAYGATGEPGPNKELLNSPILKRIGDGCGKKPEEVALRWVLQSGAAVSVRPTTNFMMGFSFCSEQDDKCEAGVKARAGIFDWSLSANEMEELGALTSPDGNPTLFSSSGCPNAFGMPK